MAWWVPLGGTGVGPVPCGVGHQGVGRPGHGGGGPRGRVERLDVDRLLLLSGRPEVWGSQRGRGDYNSPDRAEDGQT